MSVKTKDRPCYYNSIRAKFMLAQSNKRASLVQRGAFLIRFHYAPLLESLIRKHWYSLLGMSIGKGTRLPSLQVTWPHQVVIGTDCILENGIYFKYDGIWQPGNTIRIGNHVFIGSGCEFNITVGVDIGDNTLIASGCRFIDHNHGIELGSLMRTQQCPALPIKLHTDVWLGCNVVVLQGVVIGSGAVVAAGAIVTKSIPSNEIWAGVPARKIGQRST